jgi:hypothetical protein
MDKNNMFPKLKRCPFCGAKARIEGRKISYLKMNSEYREYANEEERFYVVCYHKPKCMFALANERTGSNFPEFSAAESAAEIWNMRYESI